MIINNIKIEYRVIPNNLLSSHRCHIISDEISLSIMAEKINDLKNSLIFSHFENINFILNDKKIYKLSYDSLATLNSVCFRFFEIEQIADLMIIQI